MTPKATLAALRRHALTYPEATEEFPWGDRTIKVRGKIFVFLGAGTDGFGMSVKLPATHELVTDGADDVSLAATGQAEDENVVAALDEGAVAQQIGRAHV